MKRLSGDRAIAVVEIDTVQMASELGAGWNKRLKP
jgi:hypothetical protein